jgi:hypothetical protein
MTPDGKNDWLEATAHEARFDLDGAPQALTQIILAGRPKGLQLKGLGGAGLFAALLFGVTAGVAAAQSVTVQEAALDTAEYALTGSFQEDGQ